jgi:hypothetical protein
MVCALFLDDEEEVMAAAQGTVFPDTEPKKTIFITSTVRKATPMRPLTKVVDRLRPATILHEALHGLTKKNDVDLADYFATNLDYSASAKAAFKNRMSSNSSLLSTILEIADCAPR